MNLIVMIVQLLILQQRLCRALRLFLVGAIVMLLELMIYKSLGHLEMHPASR